MKPNALFAEKLSEAGAWCWLLYSVPTKTSCRALGEAWQWNAVKVHRFLAKLETDGWLVLDATKEGTEIDFGPDAPLPKMEIDYGERSLPNLDSPFFPDQSTEPAPPGRPGVKLGTRGKRLPDNWRLPRRLGEWAMLQGLSEAEVRREAETFKDYWISVPGQRGVKRNWDATWRNWIRKSAEKGQKMSGHTDGAMDEFRDRWMQ